MSWFRELVEERLPIAEGFATRGEQLLAEQRARLAEQEQRGRKSIEGEKLLKLMETSQALHIQHVAILRRDLERGDYRPPAPYQLPKTAPPPKTDPC
jgi:hypothetical protein